MNNLQALISAIPEPLATTILTTVFTSIIVFFIQERMKKNFTEELEVIKTELQKLSKEHEIKFSANFAEALVTLDEFHKKLHNCTIASIALHRLIQAIVRKKQTLDEKTFEEKKALFLGAQVALKASLDNNRLHLPENRAIEAERIKDRARLLGMTSMQMLMYARDSKEALLKNVRSLAETMGIALEIQEGLSKEGQLDALFVQIEKEFQHLERESENLYKLVADVEVIQRLQKQQNSPP